MVRIRSARGMYWLIRFSMVVLPVPVPPLIMILRRDSTARINTSRQASVIEPFSISCWADRWLPVNLRILMVGPSRASGGMIALTREPSGNLASTIGLASSRRRPNGASMRRITRVTWSSLMNRVLARCRTPATSTKTCSGPFTRISLTLVSASNGSSGPKPVTSSRISRTS